MRVRACALLSAATHHARPALTPATHHSRPALARFPARTLRRGRATLPSPAVPSQTLRVRGSVASSLLALTSGVLLAGFTLTAQLVTAAPEYAAYGLQSRPYMTDAEPRCSAKCALPAALALPRRLDMSTHAHGSFPAGAAYSDMMGGHATHHDAGHVCGAANGALLLLTLEREVSVM